VNVSSQRFVVARLHGWVYQLILLDGGDALPIFCFDEVEFYVSVGI
jgi:hypothetical protein